MAAFGTTFLIVIALLMSISLAALDCSNELVKLSSCLAYIQNQVTAPSKECCSGLQDVHVNRPACLCQIVQGSGSTPGMNNSNTNLLPVICNVPTDEKRCPDLLKGEGPPAATPSGKSPDAAKPRNGSAVVAPFAFVTILTALVVSIITNIM